MTHADRYSKRILFTDGTHSIAEQSLSVSFPQMPDWRCAHPWRRTRRDTALVERKTDMKKLPFVICAVLAATVIAAPSAHAATAVANISATATDRSVTPITQAFTNRDSFIPLSPFSESFIGGAGASSVETFFQVNPETGVFKAKASGGVSLNGSAFDPVYRSLAGMSVFEEFTVQGSGTVSFSFAFDGTLAVGGDGSSDTYASIKAEMEVERFTPETRDFERIEREYRASTRIEEGAITRLENGTETQVVSGLWEIDESLQASIDVADGDELSILLRFQAGAGNNNNERGYSSADFASTGYLNFATTSGLTITASDPLFLSNPAVAPVPIPASMSFLLVGMGVLGASRVLRRG